MRRFFEMTKYKTIVGEQKVRGKKIAIVASRFNEFITQRLLKACLDELTKKGVLKTDVLIAWVPGSYEIPVTALRFAQKKNIHAVICLGCVIRGETYHFELIAQNVAKGILEASMFTGKSVIFGVLTVETVNQAYKRSEEKGDNKGRDCAVAALKMIALLK